MPGNNAELRERCHPSQARKSEPKIKNPMLIRMLDIGLTRILETLFFLYFLSSFALSLKQLIGAKHADRYLCSENNAWTEEKRMENLPGRVGYIKTILLIGYAAANSWYSCCFSLFFQTYKDIESGLNIVAVDSAMSP